MSLIAQLPTKDLGTVGQDNGECIGFGPFCKIGDAPKVITDLATGISNIIAFITIVGGLWFGFQFIVGALQWLSSGGDKTRIETARNRLVHAFFGLLIVVSAWAVIAILGKFFGLDILLTNPAKVACQINPTCPSP